MHVSPPASSIGKDAENGSQRLQVLSTRDECVLSAMIAHTSIWQVTQFTEVVLAALSANFVLEKSDKMIVWNLAGVSYPTVGNDSKQSQLPIKMRILK